MIRGDASFCEFSGDVLNVICAGGIGRGEVQRVGGVRVDVNRTFAMHVMPKGKDKKSDVGGSASFVNVKPSDVGVVIDVV